MEQLYYRTMGEGTPLIILHGLFGSSDNWLTLGKRFAEKYKVYLVDQRNHGQSFHSQEFTFEAMAKDLDSFMKNEGISVADIIGHSMGGKTAMEFAVTHPSKVNRLVIADIGPKSYPVHHTAILKGLFSINLKTLTSRKDANEQLAKFITDFGTRQFLLKNLSREGENYEWKVNLEVIAKEIEQIGKGINQNATYAKTACFVRGSKSDYIMDADINVIHSIFTNSKVETIQGAGHWLHAEKPEEFFQLVSKYLADA
ncbi:MAG: pimeloyl-ACP methyl ester carboxylesterase [Roseivirga sp.]|jgi:esterase